MNLIASINSKCRQEGENFVNVINGYSLLVKVVVGYGVVLLGGGLCRHDPRRSGAPRLPSTQGSCVGFWERKVGGQPTCEGDG